MPMSVCNEETIEGYFYFRARIKVIEKDVYKNPLVVVFKGSEPHGKNWSPDCNLMEETLTELFESYTLPVSNYILKIRVGSNEDWSKEECPFRTDKKLHLINLPTVILWSCGPDKPPIDRLEGKEQCTLENIHNLFLPNEPISAPVRVKSEKKIEDNSQYLDGYLTDIESYY